MRGKGAWKKGTGRVREAEKELPHPRSIRPGPTLEHRLSLIRFVLMPIVKMSPPPPKK